jgi:hypothetical protein
VTVVGRGDGAVGQLPAEIPFDVWLDYLFGNPIGPSGFRESDDWWDEAEEPERAVEYLTCLFEGSAILLARYPLDRIDRGFWYLLGESGHLQPLFDGAVTWGARRRALVAIGSLYEGLFATVCTDHLGHRDGGPEAPAPLNSSCYMWWDLFPTWGGHGDEPPMRRRTRSGEIRPRRAHRCRARTAKDPKSDALHGIDDAVLHVMAQTLRLESEACRESALHGLGHWHRAHPDRTTRIIDAWLAGDPQISPELRRDALSARCGCVL